MERAANLHVGRPLGCDHRRSRARTYGQVTTGKGSEAAGIAGFPSQELACKRVSDQSNLSPVTHTSNIFLDAK